MQDFRNTNNQVQKLPTKATIPPIPPITPVPPVAGITKKGFIKTRMNKDNLWSLIFAFTMPASLNIAGFITIFCLPLGVIALCVTVFASIFLNRKYNKVRFEDETFINSQNEDITKRIPNSLLLPTL